LTEYLKGPTAIAFVKEDAVGAAKILAKFGKELEPFEIRGGVLRGEVLSAKDVDALSKLPSKEELYAKLLGTLVGPASSLVRAMQGVSSKLARVIGAVRDTKQE
jgi:large subunit ribosomal protein L10